MARYRSLLREIAAEFADRDAGGRGLQTFDLLRSGAWGKALANVLLSVVLCFAAVAVGHILAQQSVSRAAIAETKEEEFTA